MTLTAAIATFYSCEGLFSFVSPHTVGLSIISHPCQWLWCHAREIPSPSQGLPAVVSISSFKPPVNKKVIERALRPPVSSYLHFGNMNKTCLESSFLCSFLVFRLSSVYPCVCVWVWALNRSYNCRKDSWHDDGKMQILLFVWVSSFFVIYFSSNLFSQAESTGEINLLQYVCKFLPSCCPTVWWVLFNSLTSQPT